MRKENYGEGALIQLYSKGPEDVYLANNVEKYIPEYVYGLYPFNYYLWNDTQFLAQYPRYGYYPLGY